MDSGNKEKLLAELRAELAGRTRPVSRLAEHRDLIADMRKEGAAWRTVAKYLRKAGLTISAEAVRAYWQRHEARPRPHSRRQPPPPPETKPAEPTPTGETKPKRKYRFNLDV
ncbi:MAG: hypothetical protein ABSG59_02460 [Verrucomicrobiota bacterium]|jgi:hypothetical protein